MRDSTGWKSPNRADVWFMREFCRQLGELVREEVEDLARAGKPLPEPSARPMREAVLA